MEDIVLNNKQILLNPRNIHILNIMHLLKGVVALKGLLMTIKELRRGEEDMFILLKLLNKLEEVDNTNRDDHRMLREEDRDKQLWHRLLQSILNKLWQPIRTL